VQIVVGKSFDDIVKSSKKDVLLEVYAPWCGHCKTLEPIYKKLATRFKDIDSVVIAKMDGTANEHAEINMQGFPHIVFYPAKEGAHGARAYRMHSDLSLVLLVCLGSVPPCSLESC
jgi:protein disulfide-isomerase A1